MAESSGDWCTGPSAGPSLCGNVDHANNYFTCALCRGAKDGVSTTTTTTKRMSESLFKSATLLAVQPKPTLAPEPGALRPAGAPKYAAPEHIGNYYAG